MSGDGEADILSFEAGGLVVEIGLASAVTGPVASLAQVIAAAIRAANETAGPVQGAVTVIVDDDSRIRQLNRLMREEYDRSVFEVLHEVRIERAKHLLLETYEKVIVVATMVGYEDQSFFNRLFVRHVGCSPSHFRATG